MQPKEKKIYSQVLTTTWLSPAFPKKDASYVVALSATKEVGSDGARAGGGGTAAPSNVFHL